jgi:hypothetical protein
MKRTTFYLGFLAEKQKSSEAKSSANGTIFSSVVNHLYLN